MSEFVAPSVHTFEVSPDVPAELRPLLELARNFWWVWQPEAAELFRRLDPALWEAVHHAPAALLARVAEDRLIAAAGDPAYVADLARVTAALRRDMDAPAWHGSAQPVGGAAPLRVAYFSAEFALHESLPIYSGGLGVLAGDHLKSASDLGLPLVAVGLLYRNGYFTQSLSLDGRQLEAYPELDVTRLAASPVGAADGKPLRVSVDLPEGPVACGVWRVDVGRVPLFLLDANVPENTPADREITSRLYGGGTELRIRQEIVLGIGGTRALAAMGLAVTVYHMNEGHSAFLALERVRVLLERYPTLTFDEARQAVMATSIFTTHTPVPAGIDMFSPEMMTTYFRRFYPQLKLDEEGFLALGREDVRNRAQGFSMAVLALRLADNCNAVSRLHGQVSRRMWHNLWPGVPADDVPIRSVTNGIHIRTWLSADLSTLYDRHLGPAWRATPEAPASWAGIADIPDQDLWQAHERCRGGLVTYARTALRQQLVHRGAGYDEVAVADDVLDPDALTIGFARRFATYKRGALLLRDPARLLRLLEDANRPVQFLFAGKAHPADAGGKDVIRAIVEFARQNPHVRQRLVFLENYDMAVARRFVQGVDVWLNTPRRGMEASGTSGMKAAANGVPNCSILDGWWVEGYAPDVGWAIGHGEEYADPEQQDRVESAALYDLLERQIVPEFYDRGTDGLPHHWIARMKACIAKLAPVFNTNRMVREYADRFYVPAAARGATLMADGLAWSVALAHTKDALRHRWGGIRVVGAAAVGDGRYKVGQSVEVEATVDLPRLKPDEVTVQLYTGPATPAGGMVDPVAVDMTHDREAAPDRHVFVGLIHCRASGQQGYAVRVLPADPDLATPFEPGLIAWN
jgi:starch phosphorylase